MNTPAITAIFDAAQRDGRDVLLETEGLQVLAALGLPAPAHVFAKDAGMVTAALLSPPPGDRVVVKVISPRILHKSDVDGIAVVEKTVDAVVAAIDGMQCRLAA